MTEKQIVEMAENEMIKKGATSFWYYNIGAFVFTGERTTLSVSGKNYIPTNTEICSNDIITIDLSPQIGEIWGDYARTLVVEDGKIVSANEVSHSDFKEGLEFEEKLHKLLLKSVSPNMTFEELYIY
jgi:Xaa-Pro aminopeptidase